MTFRKLGEDLRPAAGELWLRPAAADDPLRRALARLVCERGLEVLDCGPGPVTQIVVNATGTQPTFDEMLAALFVQRLLSGQALSATDADLAKYAELLRQGKVPCRHPLEETIEGIYLAIRNRAGADLTDAAAGARFLDGWQKLADRLVRAAEEGTDVFQTLLFAGSAFADEKAYLLEDQRRYRRDVSHGQRWTVRLQKSSGPESGLLLKEPQSAHFAYWSRRDTETPTGAPYLFLAVAWGKGSWDFSTDPAQDDVTLTGLAEALQQAESPHGGGAWYDGRDHKGTIVSSPRPSGTQLSDKQVLAIVQRWAGARRAGPRRPWLRVTVRGIEVLALVAVCALAVYLLDRTLRPSWHMELIPKVAPAVVMIKASPHDRGTGFLISADGWVITNSHVIETARPDLQSGARHADIYLGELRKGKMEKLPTPVRALVYRDDDKLDLALLKLKQPLDSPVFLNLAAADRSDDIKPGVDCLAFGDEWQHSPGIVRRVYEWPRQDPDVASEVFTAEDQAKLLKQLEEYQRKLILSSCGQVPGDSGGPLVNKAGEVIGVSCGVRRTADARYLLTGHTFHVHLDELPKFVQGRPAVPPPFPVPELPTDWPKKHPSYVLEALVIKRVQDEVVFKDKDRTLALWLDLNESNDRLDEADLKDPKKNLVAQQKWKYQFALATGRFPAAYYDTKGAGAIDLIVQAPYHPQAKAPPDVIWQLQGDGAWRMGEATAGRPLISADWFSSPALRKRFADCVDPLNSVPLGQ